MARILKHYFVFSLILLFGLLVNPFTGDGFNTVKSEDINKLQQHKAVVEKDICKFMEEIYRDYSATNFRAVYDRLHPEIKNELIVEEYTSFQNQNFEKYKIEITDVSIENPVFLDKLPGEFERYKLLSGDVLVVRVDVNYQFNFTVIGSRQSEEQNKKAYVLQQGENLYWLWDPAVIEDDK
ncbi:MAG TPA: hypothetical protein VKY40_10760 [Halanaerobiales bacterium]|nr:hypothetical protein [Halanaerobiales bacterium]